MLADVRANTAAIMYAKVSGYMKTVLVDRGDRVQAGQVLAVIELPEIDQQYNAAVTDLEHKRRNLARSQELLAKGNTTQVAMLQFETDARVAEANVKGLETMKGYQTIRAPFAGRVTARFVDPGTLITNAQTNFVSALPIMTISDDSRLRVYCYVQQQDVPFINVGDTADVIDASNPERRMKAKVSRMTGELETRTRTMQIEINIDNTEGFLVAGAFANVMLHIPIKSYPQIPASGLLVRGEGNYVAMIENDALRYKPIRVADHRRQHRDRRRRAAERRPDRGQPAGRDHRRQQGAADFEEIDGWWPLRAPTDLSTSCPRLSRASRFLMHRALPRELKWPGQSPAMTNSVIACAFIPACATSRGAGRSRRWSAAPTCGGR